MSHEMPQKPFDISVVYGIPSLWLESDRIPESMDYARSKGIKEILINPFRGYLLPDLEFVRDYPYIQEISIQNPMRHNFDLTPIAALRDLRKLHIGGPARLDVSLFPHLEHLSAEWHPSMNLAKTTSLVSLSLGKYRSKTKGMEQFPLFPQLKKLSLTQGNLQSIEGIQRIRSLEDLELSYLSGLRSVEPVTELHLKRLEIDVCRKVTDFQTLAACSGLERLIIDRSGKVPNLQFVNEISSLEYFFFYGTVVEDGDLTPLLRLKGAGFDNKKHYSHSEEQIDSLLSNAN